VCGSFDKIFRFLVKMLKTHPGNIINFKICYKVSSNGQHTGIGEFHEVEHVLQSVMNDAAICGEYDCRNIFRNADPMKMRTKGASA